MPAGRRLQDVLRAHDIAGEKLIAFGQASVAGFILVLHLIAQAQNNWQNLNFLIITTLAALVISSMARFSIAKSGTLSEWRLDVLTIIDFSIFLALIWSYQFAYSHPASGSLKAPTAFLIFVLISLRLLRFHPRPVAIAGITTTGGWLVMTSTALNSGGDAGITQNYITYLTSHKILIGAEIERAVAFAALTAVLAISAFNARRILSKSAHASDYLDALTAAEANLEIAEREKKRAVEAIAGMEARTQELKDRNEKFNACLETMSQGLCMFDSEKRLIVCNKRYLDIYDLPASLSKPGTHLREIIEHRIASGIYSGDDPERYIQERLAAVEERQRSTKVQKLTNSRIVAIDHEPMLNGGWLATHEDITELQRAQDELAYLAHHDDLTGLPNRKLLHERIHEAFASAGGDDKFALLCLDLDRFKNVNDTLGHSYGDALLKVVAKRILGCIREEDVVARLGGDEFAILQLSRNLPDNATSLASRLCSILGQPFFLKDHQVVIGASIGIALAPDNGADPEQLIKNADMALYRAKDDGRSTFRFFEPEMDARMQARRLLELDLRTALENGEFEVHYQPLVSSETGKVTGFEALLRWPHPTRGNVSPADFIPLAEEIGLIVPLGSLVIRQACRDAANWPEDMFVAVNLSPKQFDNGDLINVVFKALGDAGIAPRRLELEITETVLLQQTDQTLRTLHQLRNMGVRIAMDDFGTGYSSLSYLRSFPFDKIKIDASFIKKLNEDGSEAAIMKAVASLSKSLGIVSTAEGVETEEQRNSVKAAGYTQMQGFMFSRPIPAKEVGERFFPSDQKSYMSG